MRLGVMPAQPEAPIGGTAEWADPDPAIYGSDALFPSSRVEYLGDGYLGGYRIASVAVYPLQYSPGSGRLVLATDVSVELELAVGLEDLDLEQFFEESFRRLTLRDPE